MFILITDNNMNTLQYYKKYVLLLKKITYKKSYLYLKAVVKMMYIWMWYPYYCLRPNNQV